jgi:hypothetical protein
MRHAPARPARALVVLALASAALVAPAAPVLAGAEYDMVTRASYVVDETEGRVVVTVDIDFTNTFAPPSAGQVSVFNAILVAIHDTATAVTAGDGSGALNVSVASSGGVNVATITPRAPVEYGKTASISLAYELRDAADSGVRVGAHLISFPVWGFGTRSEVSVDLPATFDVRVDGSALDATVEGGRTVLRSGVVDNPTRWLSHVGATREPDYETLQQAIPLEESTVDLRVRHWVDDPAWGAETAALVADALPLLEAAFGVPYPAQGPLVITEAVTAGGPDATIEDGGLAVGFTEPAFTVLHQLAHAWAGEAISGDRWVLEGLASWAAGAVSAEMDLDLPHDPATVAESLKANAFPLVEWDESERPADVEGWAYAASWSLVGQAAASAGADAFRDAIRRMAGGLDAYDPTTAGTGEGAVLGAVAGSAAAVSSRAFLDHVDAVTEEPIVDTLAGPVLGPGAAEELAARAAARLAYDELAATAGDWGDSQPVRAAMVAWQFAEAERAIADASAWLQGRDELLADIGQAGLTAPERLSAAYRQHGGGAEAWAEIDAERAVAGAYAAVADSVAEGLDPIARVGLLLGPGPEDRLATAATAFAAGDLRAAADEVAGLDQDLATATAGGLVRLLGVVVAIGVVLMLGTVTLRRRRTGRDYTPQP